MAVRQLRVNVIGDSRSLDRALHRSTGSLSKFGAATSRVEGLVTRGLAAGLATTAGALVYSAKKAGDFESQLSTLGAVSDANAKQMGRFRKQALRAGADTKFSALEAAQAQSELAKGGLKVSQIMRGGLKSSLALAAAGEMELAEASEATVNAMKLFGLRGKSAMKVADGFATAANRTTADVSDFAMALKMGGSASKAAGMTFIETTAALEALAEVGIKGSDAGTSLKAMLVQLAAPTAKQRDLMKELRLDFFKANGEMKSLTDVSGMLRDKLGGLTKEQQLHAAKTIAGTDGMRAMLALYDAGPKKIDKFQRELGKQGTAADVAAKKQDNLQGSLEQLGGSVETLGIQVGTLMIPAIREGADELTDFANRLGELAGRDDLDIGEKLEMAFEIAKVDLEPWLDKLEVELDRADVPEKIGKAVSTGTPVIAEAMAKAAPGAAKAFITAFANANLWGQLVIGGVLLKKMGGLAAFRALGMKAGAAMGTGMAAGTAAAGGAGAAGGAAAGAAGGGLAAKLAPSLRAGAGIAGGIAAVKVATDFLKDKSDLGLLDQYAEAIERVAKAGDGAGMRKLAGQLRETAQANSDLTKGAHLHRFADALDSTAKGGGQDLSALKGAFESMAKSAGGDLERLRTHFANVKTGAAFNFDGVRTETAQTSEAFRQMRTSTANDMEQARAVVRGRSKDIKQDLGKNSAEGRAALAHNFERARLAIVDSMGGAEKVTAEGMKEIRRLFVKSLALYGLSPQHARGRDPISGQLHIPKGEGRQFQRGGPINMGAPSGDSVPAMLERGEYVMNRNAVKKVGRAALDRINFGAAPRFQQGGIVELLHPGNDPEGHGDHLHVAMSSVQAVVALGKRLQKLGWLVSEHPAFGGVNFGHAANGYHPTGQAIDVNWPNAGVEAAKIRALLPMLGGNLAAMAPDIKRILVGGADSPLKSMVQGALDQVRSAAQGQLDSMAGGIEGAEVGMSADGNVESVFAQVAKRLSRSKTATRALGMAGYAESGMRDLAYGHSTSEGALQLLSTTAAGMGIDPHDEGAVASAFLMRGFYGKGGANALAAQGLPAHLVAQGVQGSAFSDGSNYLAQAGAAAAWMRRFGLRLGGMVGMQAGGMWTPFGERSGFFGGSSGGGRGGTSLAETIRKVKGSGTPRGRRTAVKAFLKRVKGIGLPADMAAKLESYAADSNVFGDFADRAAALTDEGAIIEALELELARRQEKEQAFPAADQQAIVDQMQSRDIGGRTQLEWLTQQLGALFNWRNTIIDAEGVVVGKRTQTTGMIENARTRLGTLKEKIRAGLSRKRTLEGQLDTWQDQLEKAEKHPKRNKKQIKAIRGTMREIRGEIRGVDRNLKPKIRARDSLKDDILPALTTKRTELNTARGDLLANLEDVQGAGSTMARLAALPAVGALGGRIFDVQMTIKGLTDSPPRVVAEPKEADPEDDTPKGWSIGQLLDWAYLNNAVKGGPKAGDVPPTTVPFGGAFATGGTVPGRVGEPVMILAHGGEEVVPVGRSGGPAGGTVLYAEIDLGEGIKQRVRLEFDEHGRQQRGAWTAGVLPA